MARSPRARSSYARHHEGEQTYEENRAAYPERYPDRPKQQPTLLGIGGGREKAAGEVARPG